MYAYVSQLPKVRSVLIYMAILAFVVPFLPLAGWRLAKRGHQGGDGEEGAEGGLQ